MLLAWKGCLRNLMVISTNSTAWRGQRNQAAGESKQHKPLCNDSSGLYIGGYQDAKGAEDDSNVGRLEAQVSEKQRHKAELCSFML